MGPVILPPMEMHGNFGISQALKVGAHFARGGEQDIKVINFQTSDLHKPYYKQNNAFETDLAELIWLVRA